MKINIRFKITLMILGLIMFSISTLGILNYCKVKINIVDDIENKGFIQLKNVNEYFLKNFMKDMEFVVNRWADDETIVNYENEPGQAKMVRSLPPQFYGISQLWRGYVSSNPDIAWIYFGNEADGSLFLEPIDPTMPLDYDCRTRQWYNSTVEQDGKVIWTEPYLDAGDSGETIVTVARSVTKNEELVGVIGLDIRLRKFSEIIQELEFIDGGSIMLVGNNGYIFAHPDPVMLSKDLSDNEWSDEMINGIEGVYTTKIDGKEVVVSYLSVDNTDWKLVGVSPLNLSSSLDPIREQTFQVGGISLVITFMIGYMLSLNLTHPLRKIMATINHISSGDMKVRTKINSKDEFEVLGNEFNKMLDKVGQLISERDSSLEELTIKNIEIVEQKQKILAFSEETEVMNEELNLLIKEVRSNYLVTVSALANAIEASDHYTRGHCDRVKTIALRIADEMNLSELEYNNLEIACILHDIGKIGIPYNLLNKESALLENEFNLIKKHPQIGYDIIKDVQFLKSCSTIILQHHERIDGKGYPFGLKDKEIDRLAKVLSVADAYDAMTSARPYRVIPLSPEAAIEEFKKTKGNQFDSDIVDILIQIVENDTLDLKYESVS